LGEKLNIFPEKNPKEPLYNSEKLDFSLNGIIK